MTFGSLFSGCGLLDIEPPLSDSAKYRLCGNSVIVNVAAWLGGRIVESEA